MSIMRGLFEAVVIMSLINEIPRATTWPTLYVVVVIVIADAEMITKSE